MYQFGSAKCLAPKIAPGFLKLLVEMNTQRVKTTSDVLHETIIKVDPAKAFAEIVADRTRKEKERRDDNILSGINPYDDGRRCELSSAKQPLLDAVLRVLREQRDYWPLSDRQIHYRLLGEDAPLIHATKPESRYQNDKKSYRALTDICARGRIAGLIPWAAIEDATRPTELFSAFRNPAEFFKHEFDNFLGGYWREPDPVPAASYRDRGREIDGQIDTRTSGPRAYDSADDFPRHVESLPPKYDIYKRYRTSGKDKLILLVVSDLDPAGDAIAEDVVKSFRRDFGVHAIEAYKVALTIEQVEEFELDAVDGCQGVESDLSGVRRPIRYHRRLRIGGHGAFRSERSFNRRHRAGYRYRRLQRRAGKGGSDSREIIAVKRQAFAFFKSLSLDGVDFDEED